MGQLFHRVGVGSPTRQVVLVPDHLYAQLRKSISTALDSFLYESTDWAVKIHVSYMYTCGLHRDMVLALGETAIVTF